MTRKVAAKIGGFAKQAPKQGKPVWWPMVEAYFAEHDGLVLTPTAEMALNALLTTPQRDRSGSFSPSQRGSCLRAQVFTFLGVPKAGDRLDPTQSMVFLDGTWRHLRMQMLTLVAAEIMGIPASIEVPYENKATRTKGSIDAIVRKVVCEFKGTRMFRMAMEGPFFAHKLQVHGYLDLADLDTASIIYEDKSTQELAEHIVHRDPKLEKAVAIEVETLNHHVDQRTLPRIRPGCQAPPDAPSGNSSEWWECPYRLVCKGCTSYSAAEALAVGR